MYIRNINQIQRLNRKNIPLNVFYKYNFTAKNVKIHFLRNIRAKFHCKKCENSLFKEYLCKISLQYYQHGKF